MIEDRFFMYNFKVSYYNYDNAGTGSPGSGIIYFIADRITALELPSTP